MLLCNVTWLLLRLRSGVHFSASWNLGRPWDLGWQIKCSRCDMRVLKFRPNLHGTCCLFGALPWDCYEGASLAWWRTRIQVGKSRGSLASNQPPTPTARLVSEATCTSQPAHSLALCRQCNEPRRNKRGFPSQTIELWEIVNRCCFRPLSLWALWYAAVDNWYR